MDEELQSIEQANREAESVREEELREKIYAEDAEIHDLKKTISQSFSRKLNLGNYETADFFCSYSQELLGSSPEEDMQAASHNLYLQAKRDVEAAIDHFNGKSTDRMKEFYDSIRSGGSIPMEDWLSLTFHEQALLHKAQLLKAQEERIKAKNNEKLSPTQKRAEAKGGNE